MKNQQELGKHWPQEGDSDTAAMSGDALILEIAPKSAEEIAEICAFLAEQVRTLIKQKVQVTPDTFQCAMLKELVLQLMQNAVILKFNLPPMLVTQLIPGVLFRILNESKQGKSNLLDLAKSDPASLLSIPRFGR